MQRFLQIYAQISNKDALKKMLSHDAWREYSKWLSTFFQQKKKKFLFLNKDD